MSNLSVRETSDLQNFLNAEVGTGASGERVTVAMALSRMGFDPDLQAEILAGASRNDAAIDLANIIVATPGSLWDLAAAGTKAHQLVHLLPVRLP